MTFYLTICNKIEVLLNFLNSHFHELSIDLSTMKNKKIIQLTGYFEEFFKKYGLRSINNRYSISYDFVIDINIQVLNN